MSQYVTKGKLQVDKTLYDFLTHEVLPDSQVDESAFWKNLDKLIHEFSPLNAALLAERDRLQQLIHQFHQEHPTATPSEYRQFLQEIGYLEAEVEDFVITTTAVDREVANVAGPQLVVPVDNARYALNAANARWGSLYDALYGTDVIAEDGGAEKTVGYNAIRGQKVIAYAKAFLDESVPLLDGSHADVIGYMVKGEQLVATLGHGGETTLQHMEKFVGYQGQPEQPNAILLKNNELHIEIVIDRTSSIGQTDLAGVKDIVLESALTTIMDCEDSVAAVDAEDKVAVYRNWLGLNRGTLVSSFQKGDSTVIRTLNGDRSYFSPNGERICVKGRSVMFIRNVGHLMTSDAILDSTGKEIPEGILDTVVTSLIAKHDVIGNGKYRNSETGSIYIVKPKMHGSREVAFAGKLFDAVEDLILVPRNTIKIGVMDEERRTSLNLKNCIHAVKDRIVFINTGFLDRTGDEIHTSMEAGPMIRKQEMKNSMWLQGYEKSNVDTGLSCGFQGKAQIGKGMWAMPDLMADMLEQKQAHPKSGATTAWVPSPTAATLHALHYHQVFVPTIQEQMLERISNYTDEILSIPLATPTWTDDEIQSELDNNAQGILGYVVRWVDQGVGCSKVPDIHHIGLMEDRATLRISSQHMANWLHHGVCTKEQVLETFKRMAMVVDLQNASDPNYQAMSPNYEQSVAFQAACDLVFEGYDQPSGYTEPILHRRRREAKQKVALRH